MKLNPFQQSNTVEVLDEWVAGETLVQMFYFDDGCGKTIEVIQFPPPPKPPIQGIQLLLYDAL